MVGDRAFSFFIRFRESIWPLAITSYWNVSWLPASHLYYGKRTVIVRILPACEVTVVWPVC